MLTPFILTVELEVALVAELRKIINAHLTKLLTVATIEMMPLTMGIKSNRSAQVVHTETEYLPIYWFTTYTPAIDWL
jgi:hypothetical protein